MINVHGDMDLVRRYSNKVANCKTRKIDFLLSFDEFKALQNKTHCEYTGKEFILDPTSPSNHTIDRVDASKPYTADNCVACTWQANQSKEVLDRFEKDDYFTAEQKVALLTRTLYRLRKEARKERQAAKKAESGS